MNNRRVDIFFLAVEYQKKSGERGLAKEAFSIAQAKKQTSCHIHDIETGAQAKLTGHGEPVAILLSIKMYDDLMKGRKEFWKALFEFPIDLKKKGGRQ